jgi:CRISPR/Cas system Type II protein with McrA/HNH and RuvC-like nuclease domain
MKNVVDAIIAKHGNPDIIRLEMAKELSMPKENRQEYTKAINAKSDSRTILKDFLEKEKILPNGYVTRSDIRKLELFLELEYQKSDYERLIIERKVDKEELRKFVWAFRKFRGIVSDKDQTKWRLWVECNRICPYTGKTIKLTDVFSSAYEVEHIIPYSRCLDNSFKNLTLSDGAFNKRKDNRTPFEMKSEMPDGWWEGLLERISTLPKGKQRLFTADLAKELTNAQATGKANELDVKLGFRPGSLENTAYIAKEARKKLEQVCTHVEVLSGRVTSELRKHWGLDSILYKNLKNLQNGTEEYIYEEIKKERGDHRHHTIDAIVIACCNRTMIHYLANEVVGKRFVEDRAKKMITPWGKLESSIFRSDVAEAVLPVLVSYYKKDILVSKRKNFRTFKDITLDNEGKMYFKMS